ncbi:hypothetical protein THAOC_19614, partial [Thalassiosira oceanica]
MSEARLVRVEGDAAGHAEQAEVVLGHEVVPVGVHVGRLCPPRSSRGDDGRDGVRRPGDVVVEVVVEGVVHPGAARPITVAIAVDAVRPAAPAALAYPAVGQPPLVPDAAVEVGRDVGVLASVPVGLDDADPVRRVVGRGVHPGVRLMGRRAGRARRGRRRRGEVEEEEDFHGPSGFLTSPRPSAVDGSDWDADGRTNGAADIETSRGSFNADAHQRRLDLTPSLSALRQSSGDEIMTSQHGTCELVTNTCLANRRPACVRPLRLHCSLAAEPW